MRTSFILLFFSYFLSFAASGQMLLRGDTLLGNEWIDYDKTYYRMDVVEDGLHKITGSALDASGIQLPAGEKWQLWFMGEEVPLYVSDDDDFGDDDMIIFYGLKNRCGLDSLLFPDQSDQLNPRYSLFTDTSSYYLTSTSEAVTRLKEGAISIPNAGESLPFYRRTFYIDSNSVFHSAYLRAGTQKLYSSEFDQTSGFSSQIRSSYSQSVNLPNHVFVANDSITFSLRLASFYSSRNEDLILRYQLTTDIFEEDSLKSFEVAQKSYQTPSRSNGAYIIAISRINHAMQRNFMVSHFSFKYPSEFVISEDKSIRYQLNATNKNIVLKKTIPNTTYFVLNNLNGQYGFFTSVADTFKYSHPAEGGYYIAQETNSIHSIIKFVRIQPMLVINPRDNNFAIVTSKILYNQATKPNHIDDYIYWRASIEGGGYNSKLYFIEDLYDEFGYGVRRHPLALNNFSEAIKQTDPNTQLLIIGKGRAYSLTRTQEELEADENASFFVPSFGFPPSDPLAISPIGQINPRLSSGRLAISSLDEVGIYLNNVKQYETKAETIPSKDINWKKKIIHLSGGNDQANAVRRVFDKMSTRIQATEYAPEIVTFYKNGTIPIDSSQSDVIYSQINKGSSVVTFFGHSAPNTLGFRIDNENKYANAPLHPLFIALGCSAGNYNISSQSVGENYCLMENRGFLNLISTTGISILFNLDSVGRNLYEFIGKEGAMLSHGQLLNKTIKQVASAPNGRRQAGQLSLFGDPSIRLHTHKETDITVDKTSIHITPNIVGLETDSLDFTFDLLNLGRSPQQPVFITVTRADPSGSLSILLDSLVSLKGYRTSVSVRIPINRENFTGQNRLLVDIDNANLIDEKLFVDSELNNSYLHSDNKLGFPLFIPNDGMTAIWPRDKSIIPSTEVVFFANSGNLLSTSRDYYLEIDTATSFNSPLYKQYIKNSDGGVIDFSPDYSFETNRVYYWRVSPPADSLMGEYFWTPHQSFIIIPNKEGWNISHFHQFVKTKKSGLELLVNQQWSFTKDFIPVRFGNGIWNSEDQDQLGWFEFNHPFPTSSSLAWELDQKALGVIAFDHVNNRLVNPANGAYGSIPSDNDKDYFAFENTATGRDSLIAFIEQVIPSNFNIIFFTIRNNSSDVFNTVQWPTDSLRNNGSNIYNLLERFGATKIRQFSDPDQVNYLSYFNKNEGHRFEDISFNDDLLIIDFNMTNWGGHGDISLSNDIILPEDQSLLKWKFKQPVDSLDTYLIYAKIPESSTFNYLSDNSLNDSIAVDLLSDSIRYLSNFWAEIADANLTNPMPTQSQHFRMYGLVIGDYAIAPSIFYEPLKAIYQAAEPISGAVSLINIHHSVEQLPIRVFATHLATNEETEFSNNVVTIESNQSYILNLDGVLNLAGDYLVTIEINANREFSEATFFNNVLKIPINIQSDKASPKLDVTFDQTHIFNGQIVSPTTTIEIDLNDENTYVLLDNNTLLQATIQQPDGSNFVIDIGNNAVYILPTTTDNNTLTLNIKGDFEQDGTYHLSVNGRDASGNQYDVAYDVDFQVFHKNGLGIKTHPNPVVDELFIDYILFGPPQFGTLELTINNVAGQTVLTTEIPLLEGHHQYGIIVPATWPSGLYQYQINAKGENGKDYAEYTDESLGFTAGGRLGQFVLVRSEK